MVLLGDVSVVLLFLLLHLADLRLRLVQLLLQRRLVFEEALVLGLQIHLLVMELGLQDLVGLRSHSGVLDAKQVGFLQSVKEFHYLVGLLEEHRLLILEFLHLGAV